MTEPAEQTTPLTAYLLAVLSTLMAPALPDLHLARLAAQEAIAAYQASDAREQMTIVQILAFAVTALDTLRLSMPPDLSLSMKLKLRGNATGLNRATRDNTQILEQIRQTATTRDADLAGHAAMIGWQTPEPETQPEIPPATKAPNVGPSGELDLAGAMKTVASRLLANAEAASPAQKKVNAIWAGTLTTVADEIARGHNQPTHPGMTKAGLLRTTMMSGGQDFPAHLLK